MAERICLMTSYPTKCKDNCFNCKCGGEGATKDMYVSIHNVQRVCAITGGATDTDEGEYIAEVIRNNLENMVISVAELQPVKQGRWVEKPPYKDETVKGLEFQIVCSECDEQNCSLEFDENHNAIGKTFYRTRYCPNCGADMRGDTNG